VDNFQSEKQQRLLVDPQFKVLSTPFIAAANVGLFYIVNKILLCPMLPEQG